VKIRQSARDRYAKSGIALPNGKFPIPDKAHLKLAIQYRHKGKGVSYGEVVAHIRKRAAALGVKLTPAMVASGHYDEFIALTAAAGPKGKYGRSASLKWPHLYDVLRSKGYDKTKAAKISNSRLRFRKTGRKNVLTAKQAHTPAVLARLNKAQKAGKHLTARQLTKGIKVRTASASPDVLP
jgi:hypothetical protein